MDVNTSELMVVTPEVPPLMRQPYSSRVESSVAKKQLPLAPSLLTTQLNI